jgi:hypothetical protein
MKLDVNAYFLHSNSSNSINRGYYIRCFVAFQQLNVSVWTLAVLFVIKRLLDTVFCECLKPYTCLFVLQFLHIIYIFVTLQFPIRT